MKKLALSLFALATILLSGCSKWAGDPITQTFSIKGIYTELRVEDAFDVTVSDTVDQVVITAGDNVMPHIVVKEEGKTLNIYIKGWRSNRGGDLTVILPYNASLTDVDLSGASSFNSEFGLKGVKVEVDLSGSSDFICDIEADEISLDLSGASDFSGMVAAKELDIDLSGSSDATIEGTVETLDLDLSGSSTIKQKIVDGRYALVTGNCEGSLSGSSDAYIHCDGFISVDLSGASTLYYTGSARTSGSSTSGSSNIVHNVLR